MSRQAWFDGFLGACGGSYAGQVQWHMATHSRMSAIAPEVSGLVTVGAVGWHMLINAYAKSVGKGEGKSAVTYFDLEAQMLEETLATGYFNEPLHSALPAAGRNSRTSGTAAHASNRNKRRAAATLVRGGA